MGVTPQNVTITSNTYKIIKNDVLLFRNKNNKLTFNGILNRIIKNYNGKSSADFSYSSDEIERIINSALNNLESEDKKGLSEKLFIARKKAFFEEKNKPIHGVSFKFSISEKTMDTLNVNHNIFPDTINDYSYEYIGKYLHYLFEDYASQSLNIREKIIFADFYEEIENAIENNKLLRAELNGGVIVFIKPYQIMNDSETNYNYLVGFSHFENEENNTICSYRISRLNKISVYGKKETITKNEQKEIEKILEVRTPAYISYEPTSVKVLLTNKGQHLYSILQHNRPKFTAINNKNNDVKEYIFYCSENQAKNYFLKFGADATIIEPESLKNEIKGEFEKAVLNYSNNSI